MEFYTIFSSVDASDVHGAQQAITKDNIQYENGRMFKEVNTTLPHRTKRPHNVRACSFLTTALVLLCLHACIQNGG